MMSKSISISETAAWLEARDNFLVLTHIRPDGDTLCSAAGLTQGLRELGKAAYMLQNIETTSRYLPYVGSFWAPDDFVPQHVVAVDTATAQLIPANASQYLDKISLCIDHHGTNTMYADLVCCRSDTAACGEIVFAILDIMAAEKGVKVSTKTAECLYIAIATDTGCFCYRNTTSDTHKTAALLIEHGAPHADLNKLFFRTKRRQRTILEGLIYSCIEFFYNSSVAIVTITREMMKDSGADEDDIEDISNLPSTIEGVGMGITIREMSSPTDCKISVRATPPYNASEFCKNFGGGGHKAAAGASFKKSVQEVKQDLLAVLDSYDFEAS